jgi:hypothetical protein
MKEFTILKVGYSWSRMYGLSDEFFTTIVYKPESGLFSFCFHGLYGANSRIAEALRKQGFNERHTSSDFGMMTRKKTMLNLFKSEEEALTYIKSL